jgi:methionine-rich copper-binding protein CopC
MDKAVMMVPAVHMALLQALLPLSAHKLTHQDITHPLLIQAMAQQVRTQPPLLQLQLSDNLEGKFPTVQVLSDRVRMAITLQRVDLKLVMNLLLADIEDMD